MAISWQDSSEVNAGLILDKRKSANSVNPDRLFPPYNDIIKAVQNGMTEPELLIERFGIAPIQAALDAAHNLNGTGELDWSGILEQKAAEYEAGAKLEKFGRKMQVGDNVDFAQVRYYAELAQRSATTKFTPLSKVEEADTPYIKTGWSPVDKQLFGIPKVGLVVVGGPTGAGKTWLFTKLSACFAQTHPEKVVAFFSLEMMLEEIKGRYKPYDLPLDVQERILLYPHPTEVENVIAQAATLENLGLVGIDFADLLIPGETTAAAMEKVYKVLMLGAKELGVPIILLAQLTGYNGGVPTPDMMRWTRLAGMLGWSVWTVYNPLKDWFGEEASKNAGLPLQRNTAFLCAWKMRGGFWKEGPDGEKVLRDDDPIAIQTPYLVDKGWGDKSRTYSLQKDAS
jgi:hypothetical protein